MSWWKRFLEKQVVKRRGVVIWDFDWGRYYYAVDCMSCGLHYGFTSQSPEIDGSLFVSFEEWGGRGLAPPCPRCGSLKRWPAAGTYKATNPGRDPRAYVVYGVRR